MTHDQDCIGLPVILERGWELRKEVGEEREDADPQSSSREGSGSELKTVPEQEDTDPHSHPSDSERKGSQPNIRVIRGRQEALTSEPTHPNQRLRRWPRGPVQLTAYYAKLLQCPPSRPLYRLCILTHAPTISHNPPRVHSATNARPVDTSTQSFLPAAEPPVSPDWFHFPPYHERISEHPDSQSCHLMTLD
ncbi:hypothetical protein PISMIDRAFT_687410 [Pisolithus microcarpus 441]|uniref:Uncharacterized protein n=1 Tax=Pisolithus microcarpus 441 TaxID=765257 RepID=A0A0C9YN04_9AGAM|nr:hypothetical protein PISMIDRAFT_687410 [Pisolithus microcarpus 441]